MRVPQRPLRLCARTPPCPGPGRASPCSRTLRVPAARQPASSCAADDQRVRRQAVLHGHARRCAASTTGGATLQCAGSEQSIVRGAVRLTGLAPAAERVLLALPCMRPAFLLTACDSARRAPCRQRQVGPVARRRCARTRRGGACGRQGRARAAGARGPADQAAEEARDPRVPAPPRGGGGCAREGPRGRAGGVRRGRRAGCAARRALAAPPACASPCRGAGAERQPRAPAPQRGRARADRFRAGGEKQGGAAVRE